MFIMDGRLIIVFKWKSADIFPGVISIPIALYGFFALPDLPHNTKAFYLKQEVSVWPNLSNDWFFQDLIDG